MDNAPKYRHECKPGCGPHLCEFCGQEFTPRRSDARYCSRDHRFQAWTARQPKRQCSVEGCEQIAIPGLRIPLCSMHRWRKRYGRELEGPKQHVGGQCSVEGCERKADAKGMCGMHRKRVVFHGTPGSAKPLLAPKGSGVIVEGYHHTWDQAKRRRVGTHRLVMQQVLGRELYPHESPHHKNGIRNDNRPENLELMVSHRYGQRVEDVIAFVVEHYPKAVMVAMGGRQLELEDFK